MEDVQSFREEFESNDVDPAAEFLAREQNELAGLEDEMTLTGDEVNSAIVNQNSPNTTNHEDYNGHAESNVNISPKIPREEPEKIKKWREDQKKMLEEKDRNEEIKKEEWKVAAKKELEEWYKHQDDLVAKTRAANRNAEKQFVADTRAIEPGTEWERIAKLCDFNQKSSRTSKDVSRMRSIILQLKQTPLHSTKEA